MVQDLTDMSLKSAPVVIFLVLIVGGTILNIIFYLIGGWDWWMVMADTCSLLILGLFLLAQAEQTSVVNDEEE